ncbi:hypothetical protein [Thioalkalivibrio sulfidiphilus]|uniref:Uncharacterized protein n=1 Tax=Thioalkalivibrio sulfidiphilus (strain HL-EbGR7) TaxID=396588 RepID=B8GQL8_THISH|nr:hypothetical protein [Thioalkalivibrio sulfidiphilus]ACL74242.1 conserved hypothetical protein [Thioalkalivibrio sulfidiphilus HL-EbGr7]
MSFIRIFPLQEIEHAADEHFGKSQPARCHATDRFDAREFYLNVDEIAAFEECPLYLISEQETDALVNGIRIRLRSGARFVIPDDPEDEEASFLALLGRALKGEIVEMEFSRYLGSLAKP